MLLNERARPGLYRCTLLVNASTSKMSYAHKYRSKVEVDMIVLKVHSLGGGGGGGGLGHWDPPRIIVKPCTHVHL